jgi:retinol dehydrogenase-12
MLSSESTIGPPSAPRDLEDYVVVVTGASAGIGKATAAALARRGARLLLANRSEAKSRPLVESLRRDFDNPHVDFVPLDLADLSSVRRAAQRILARREPLHVLVNNAGLGGQRGVTADGFELHFGVNHLGHFLLTELLRERLIASAPARVVTVASRAHRGAHGIDWAAVQGPTRTFTGGREYRVSKLANVLFSAELAQRLQGSGVTTYSLHPGVVASDIWRRVPAPIRGAMKLFMISIEEGAKTTLHCATAPELAAKTGLYYEDCEPRTPSPAAQDGALAAELWRRSVGWCGLEARR